MPIVGLEQYSTTPGSNTDINSVNIAEGCAPSGINNAIRQLMADVKRSVGTKGSDIASASSIDLGAATGQFVDVTGTTTITALGTVAAGTVRTVRFTGALTLTHNATSLILPGGANITTANGDVAEFVSLGSGNWVCSNYQKASGVSVVVGTAGTGISISGATIAADIASQAEAEAGSSSTKLMTPQRVNQAITALGGSAFAALANRLEMSIISAQAGGNSINSAADAFITDTIGATSTSETYNAAGDYYTSEGTESATQSQTGGGAGANLSSGGYIAQSFQVSTTDQITALEIKTNSGADGAAYTLTLEADSAGAPSGVALATANVTLSANSTVYKGTLGAAYTPATSTTYWLVLRRDSAAVVNSILDYQTSSGYASGNLRSTSLGNQPTYDLYFKVYQTPAAANMTLVSGAYTAASAPTTGRIAILHDPVDSVTVNTDLKAYISRDGGTTYTQVTLTTGNAYDGSYTWLYGSADISGQPSGTSIKYKIETLNTKAQRIRGVAIGWQ